MAGVFKLSREAKAQVEAINQEDPSGLREMWRVLRVLADSGWVPGIAAPYQRGPWRTAPGGTYLALYRSLTPVELEPGEEVGILVASIVKRSEITLSSSGA